MATRLNHTAKRSRVIAESGTTKQETFLLREIAEGREGEGVVLVDAPGQLARVERGRDFILDGLTESLGQE